MQSFPEIATPGSYSVENVDTVPLQYSGTNTSFRYHVFMLLRNVFFNVSSLEYFICCNKDAWFIPAAGSQQIIDLASWEEFLDNGTKGINISSSAVNLYSNQNIYMNNEIGVKPVSCR